MATRHHFFATCAPGLEHALLGEAKALGLPRAEGRGGGIAFEGTEQDGWRANLWLRTAIRVLQRVARFPARTTDELYEGVHEVPWEEYMQPEGTLLVDARANLSALDHTQFIEQRVKDAMVDRFRNRSGTRPSVDKDDPDLRVNVHVFKDRATVSLDTSGHSLHRRGWRKHQGRAPLSETTAAALILLSGWDRRAPLLDPFCGTGTIPIEAAWIAANIAPGLQREFGFERRPGHDARAFAALKEEARALVRPTGKLRLHGWDRDRERVQYARENAESAGVAERIEFEVADARQFAPRPGWNAWIVTNPPYGKRIGSEAGDGAGRSDLTALYSNFGKRLRERCAGFHLSLLSGDPQLCRSIGFDSAPRAKIVNGGIDCELLQVETIE